MKKIELMGLYYTNEQDCYLFELLIWDQLKNIKIDKILLPEKHVSKSSWQAAYDEKYLNKTGTEVIGDLFKKPEITTMPVRICFYMYIYDLNSKLKTQYGSIKLSTPTKVPDRLNNILHFVLVD